MQGRGTGGDAFASYGLPSLARKKAGELRNNVLWSLADGRMAQAGFARVGWSAVWIGAVAAGSPRRWDAAMGIPSLVGGMLAAVHHSRRAVSWLWERSSRQGYRVLLTWLFPYRDTPHINLTGLVESGGLVLLATSIGRPLHVLEGRPSACLVAIGATAGITTGVLANAVAHVSWYLDWGGWRVSTAILHTRYVLLAAVPVIGGWILGASGVTDSRADDSALGALAGGAVICGALLEIRRSRNAASAVTKALADMSKAIGNTASITFHSQVRTEIRMLSSLLVPPVTNAKIDDARLATKRLLARTNATRHALVNPDEAATLEDLIDEDFGAKRRVQLLDAPAPANGAPSDLKVVALTGSDVEIARIALGDLVGNALMYTAGPVQVGLDIDPTANLVRLSVLDDGCAQWDDVWLKAGSLGSLRALLEHHGGGLVARSAPGGGRSVLATWTPEPGEAASVLIGELLD